MQRKTRKNLSKNAEHPTRRVRYSVAISLDGFIAGPGGEADWIVMDPEIDFDALFDEFDTLLMGRRTFEEAGGGGPRNMRTLVFSRTLRQEDYPAVTIVSARVKETLDDLRAQPGKDIIVMSGGNFATSLLKEGLVDEIGLNIHPLLLGGGVPAFLDPGMRVNLELTETRQLDGGCVLVTYNVKR